VKKAFVGKFFLFILFCFCSGYGFADELWQFYRINAQYRGAVKKSFRDVGCGLAWFKELKPGQSQVIIHVCAQNPEKKSEVFAFRVNLLLAYNNESTWVVKEVYKDFEGIHGKRENEVLQMVCLWDLIRRHTRSGASLGNMMNLNGHALSFDKRKVRQNREITCHSAHKSGFSGKFFLERVGQNNWQIDKFRFRNGKVSVSMVQDTSEAVSKDFRYRQPFATKVFDNN
jgi:hypothetical protein